jgi:hypothetical protein
MMDRPDMDDDGSTAKIDTSVAHIARVYDYWLGGKDNYAADREMGDRTIAAYPDLVSSVRANRDFLARAVRYLTADAGIRQFLDVGTGIPTANNTHEVAQGIAPESKIVYVDNDPVVLAHARALLTSSMEGTTDYIDADIRDTGRILDRAARVLDFSRPVAVMLVAVLHCIPDSGRPEDIVARLVGAACPGSFVTISHPASDIAAEAGAEIARRFNEASAAPVTMRSRERVLGFFDGLELVPPGVVRVPEWRPASDLEARRASNMWGGIGGKN